MRLSWNEIRTRGTSHTLLYARSAEMVDMLVKAGAEVNCQGGSPLLLAVETENVEVVDTLLASGANVELRISNREKRDVATLLHLAAEKRNLTLVKVFLKAGIDVSSRSKRGLTPLHSAASAWPASPTRRKIAVIKALLDEGANVEVRDIEGRKPYDWLSNWEQMKTQKRYMAIREVLGGK